MDKEPYASCKEIKIITTETVEEYTVDKPYSSVVSIRVKIGNVINDKHFVKTPQTV